jgi:hypothetical protein
VDGGGAGLEERARTSSGADLTWAGVVGQAGMSGGGCRAASGGTGAGSKAGLDGERTSLGGGVSASVAGLRPPRRPVRRRRNDDRSRSEPSGGDVAGVAGDSGPAPEEAVTPAGLAAGPVGGEPAAGGEVAGPRAEPEPGGPEAARGGPAAAGLEAGVSGSERGAAGLEPGDPRVEWGGAGLAAGSGAARPAGAGVVGWAAAWLVSAGGPGAAERRGSAPQRRPLWEGWVGWPDADWPAGGGWSRELGGAAGLLVDEAAAPAVRAGPPVREPGWRPPTPCPVTAGGCSPPTGMAVAGP